MALKINKKNTPDQLQAIAKSGVPVSVKGASGVLATEVQYADGSVKTSEKQVADVAASGPMAFVEVSMGLTRNLGNYESVRIHVGLTLPCPATPEEIDNAYHEAKGWVDTHIEQVSSEIDSELGG